MGQSQSTSPQAALTPEQLSARLSQKLSQHCFSNIELYSFKDNFKTLAEATTTSDGHTIHYWSEDTLLRFLEIPDSLEVGPIVFRMASYLAAWPFPSLAPAILDWGGLIKVVAVMTGRVDKIIQRRGGREKVLFRALAVHEKDKARQEDDDGDGIDTAREYDEDEEDEDELTLAALDVLDAIDVFGVVEQPKVHRAKVPRENLKRIIAFLLVIAPLGDNQPIASLVERFSGESLEGIWSTSENILRSFGAAEDGIGYMQFRKVITKSLPYLFDGLMSLFEHFLFSKKVDMHTNTTPSEPCQPLLPPATGTIMNLDLLSELSFFIKGERLWRRLRLLYAGSEAGFSMGSFETKVLKWAAPTILLVSGTRIFETPEDTREKAFAEKLPGKRYPGSYDKDGRVVFGAYLGVPWKVSHKECFGDSQTLLFQIYPTHEIFHASPSSPDHCYFSKEAGISFGSPLPRKSPHHSQQQNRLNLGPVSLTFDHSLEFGVFQHVGTGGAFYPSGSRMGDWQDRFEIEEIEVWGCGGKEEAEAQKKAWEWEEREALLRRHVHLGKDIESDRALLEMAGLIGGHRTEESQKATIYAASDRATAREELQKLETLYQDSISLTSADEAAEIKKRVWHRLRELRNAVERLNDDHDE
ncbi:Restriction of telomere capping protein 5 [Rhizina undulata]